MTSEAAKNLVVRARSLPQAPKRGHILNDLAARLKSCPSRTGLSLEFFRNLFKRHVCRHSCLATELPAQSKSLLLIRGADIGSVYFVWAG